MHIPGFCTGLQDLLCDGIFVDLRISCADHSPSDGLGSHRAMLAAASPLLLSCLLETGQEEEDMVCLLLPDFSAAEVASVLSILYYGEIWTTNQIVHQVDAINSLCETLCLDLAIVGSGHQMDILSQAQRPPTRRPPIKQEPIQDYLGNRVVADNGQAVLNIKREQLDVFAASRSNIPTVQTAMVAVSTSSSWLKCPTAGCKFHSSSITDMQIHMGDCSAISAPVAAAAVTKQSSMGLEEQEVQNRLCSPSSSLESRTTRSSSAMMSSSTTTPHVDVKLSSIKREPIKQEGLDPLGERKLDIMKATTAAEARTLPSASSPLKTDKIKQEVEEEDDEEEEDMEDESLADQISISDSSESIPERGRLSCGKCAYRTTSRIALQSHIIVHQRKEQLKPFKTECPVCSEKFSVVGQLKEHLVSAYLTTTDDGRLACRLEDSAAACATSYAPQQARLKLLFYHHVLYDHFGERFKFRCDLCLTYRATTASKLRQHLASHSDERPHACTVCPQVFRTRPKLADHVKIVHERARAFACATCEATFARARDLKKHQESAHLSGEDAAVVRRACNSCGKTFSSAQSLRTHQRNVHKEEGERLICDRCAMDSGTCKCSSSKADDAAEKENERTVVCPLCNKTLAARRMAGHLHYHRQSSLRPYICQQCSKTFTHAASLKRHALLHTGVKAFTCDVCGKQFYQKAAYETHCRSHTTERLACRGCGQLFLTQYLLNFHHKSRRLCRAVYEK